MAGSGVFVGDAVFSPRLWRLCEVCVGSGVGGEGQSVRIGGGCLANSQIGDVGWWQGEISPL